jgi:hypothetical protein
MGRNAGQGASIVDIHRRRKKASPAALRKKAAAGETTGDERALVRVGKAATKVLTGEDDLSNWDNEELRRGQRRDRNGRFQGRAPLVVPKALHDELVRRVTSEAQALMNENLVAAVQVLVTLVTDEGIEAKDRLKAVEMIMNRVMGKEASRLELDPGDKPWQVALLHAIVPTTPQGDEQ